MVRWVSGQHLGANGRAQSLHSGPGCERKQEEEGMGPTMPPRHVTNNTESTSKAHCCGEDQAFTRRDPHGC